MTPAPAAPCDEPFIPLRAMTDAALASEIAYWNTELREPGNTEQETRLLIRAKSDALREQARRVRRREARP